MSCKNICRLCDKLVLSQSVSYADGVVTINLPDGSYANGKKYCIVIAQTIPTTAIIGAPVVFTIGDGTTTYPLVNRCCVQVTACGIRTRTRYSVIVATSATGASFKMLGTPCCSPDNRLAAVDATTGGATT